MVESLTRIAETITLSGGKLSVGARYGASYKSARAFADDNCDCSSGDCYCTDCNSGSDCGDE